MDVGEDDISCIYAENKEETSITQNYANSSEQLGIVLPLIVGET